MWDESKLNEVVKETRRFLDKAVDLQGALETERCHVETWNEAYKRGEKDYPISECELRKELGAVRRASMDLTRALAEYRR